jgi:hypothetical protein
MNLTGYKTTARLFGALLLATGTIISTQQASHAQAQQFGIVNSLKSQNSFCLCFKR